MNCETSSGAGAAGERPNGEEDMELDEATGGRGEERSGIGRLDRVEEGQDSLPLDVLVQKKLNLGNFEPS